MNSLSGVKTYELGVLLRRAGHVTYRVRAKELQKYGISPPEAAVLHIVEDMDGQATPALISKLLIREPHSVTELLNRMSKKGLVKKYRDLENKKIVRVVLSEKGRIANSNSMNMESITRLMSSLSEQDRQELITLLRKILDSGTKELTMTRYTNSRHKSKRGHPLIHHPKSSKNLVGAYRKSRLQVEAKQKPITKEVSKLQRKESAVPLKTW